MIALEVEIMKSIELELKLWKECLVSCVSETQASWKNLCVLVEVTIN